MHICMDICMCVCMYVCMYFDCQQDVCSAVFFYMYVVTVAPKIFNRHPAICKYVCMYVCMYVCVYVRGHCGAQNINSVKYIFF